MTDLILGLILLLAPGIIVGTVWSIYEYIKAKLN